MAKFQITGGYGHVNTGRVYDEHTKFGRCVTPSVTWVCLVTGVNESKYYALSNLREVKPARLPFMTDMEFTCAEPPPMCIYPMPAVYPRDVFLGIANGLLELAKREVDNQLALAKAVRYAVADGQIPDAEAA